MKYNIIYYGLQELNLTWTERDVFNGFWGIEFTVDKPRGKGSSKLIKELIDIDFYPVNTRHIKNQI